MIFPLEKSIKAFRCNALKFVMDLVKLYPFNGMKEKISNLFADLDRTNVNMCIIYKLSMSKP